MLALHKLLRLPPSSFSLAELLSLHWLHMPPPLRFMSTAVMWRAAGRTFSGWGESWSRLRARAFAEAPAIQAVRGEWCAPCWRNRKSI
eukprot:6649662-Pyramimonas_sp.AAC.1